jgi:cell division protein FtsQ
MHQSTDKKNKIIIYSLFLFILSTTTLKFTKNQNSYSSTVNKINIEGLSNTKNTKILNELKNIFYGNILVISKKDIQNIISKYNIIEEYSVQKIYPTTINVNIKPTKFIAKISNEDQLFVGANGKLVKDKLNNKKLPYIFGKFNSEDFLFFKNNIEKSKFTFSRLKTLYFFPSNRWDVLTSEDILIKLPQDNILESLNFAYKIISSNDFKNKNLIDLRINKHLVTK